MYSLFNIQTLFKQENDIYNELIKQNVQDPDLLNEISQEITTQPSLHVKIIPFLKYLTLDTRYRLLEKLSCINTYFMAYLADEQQVQSIIFMYCFKIWDSGQDIFDAEVHHLLYSILERCKISDEIWQEELDNSNNGKKAKSLEMYDNMIEDYLFDPSDNYPKNVQLDKDVNITASARFALFNVLYAQDMRSIHFTNDELFKLSDECIALIQQLDKSTFLIETKIVENALRNPELKCYSMKQTINDTCTKLITTDTLDTMMRECCNLLIHAPMFVNNITLCLVHLLHYAKNNCTEQLYHQYIMMCQAAWLKIFQALLNNLVFSNPQKSQSYTTLSECCACFLQFHRYTQYNDMSDFHQHINTIWADFKKKRLIYLNSTNLKDNKLPWLEQLFITGTISNSNN